MSTEESKRKMWASLAELEADPMLPDVKDEFGAQISSDEAGLDRRTFFKLMGASIALAGLSGCRPKLAQRVVPYVHAPEEIVPGDSLFYATALTLGGYATGALVRTETGRPVKVEGNPLHPSSLGGTDAYTQAAILGLYDPDRSGSVLFRGKKEEWGTFEAAIKTEFDRLRAAQGEGLRILTETVTSPTLARMIQAAMAEMPKAQWHCFEPVNRDNVFAGSQLAFGQDVEPVYDFTKADVILSLDADFLTFGPGRIAYSRDFSGRRKVRKGAAAMNRLYAVEATPSSTGARADHRLPVRASEIARFAAAVAAELGVPGPLPGLVSDRWKPWVKEIAADLAANRGKCVVVPGEFQPAVVHALAHSINEALGAFGSTVRFLPPIAHGPLLQQESLRRLADDMSAGSVRSLIVLGGNPVFSSPSDIPFADGLAKVAFTLNLSPYVDETSDLCLWHVPMAHELESWGDYRGYDGTVTLAQPLIEPLKGGKSPSETLAACLGKAGAGRDFIRATWEEEGRELGPLWEKTLSDGFLAGSALPTRTVAIRKGWFAGLPGLETPKVTGLEIVFRPDVNIYDGRFANNAWLQELPKPMSKITWDNAAIVSPATAKKLGLTNRLGPTGKEDLVTLADLSYGGKTLTRVPVWIQPGQPDDSVCVNVGYGRMRVGSVGNSVGFDAYALRSSSSPDHDEGASLRARTEEYSVATTQIHHRTEGRDIFRLRDISELGKPAEPAEPLPSMYPSRNGDGNAWAMVFDTNICTGCNACVVACQAENNISCVGKTDVIRGREMHWLRIDRYYEGGVDDSDAHFIPVTCMQCEQAPCEVVCPVAATVHSDEGLNEMVYNRCIGTRYCSNNCPYKVRRFNFRQYVDKESPLLKLMRNPQVTVRGRGVMEKCTYCVQRINAARKTARKENREIRDGEVVTACQAACPTGGIVFGNLHDKSSEVAQLRDEPHHYTLLEELNVRPRTTYLARYRNPNPKLQAALKGGK